MKNPNKKRILCLIEIKKDWWNYNREEKKIVSGNKN